jgi:hypothetical protein
MHVAGLSSIQDNAKTDFSRAKGETMTRFRMICPDCGAVVLSTSPRALVWELCPGCRHHVWDADDVMMADDSASGSGSDDRRLGVHAGH